MGAGIILGRGPWGELLVGDGVVGAGLDLDDGGVFIEGKERVPDVGLEVDEATRVARAQECAIVHVAVILKEEEGDGAVDDDDGLGGLGLGMAVGAHVGARLHEVDEALHLALIGAMDGLHDAEAGAGPRGREARCEKLGIAKEDVARGFREGEGAGG